MTPKRECAFCPETANRSGEHLWSDWINDLVPGRKKFTIRDENGHIVRRWESKELDWKAKVVCQRCNNTWMSDIENNHAKPAMTDLIMGKVDVPITREKARSIALFGFKTAVVFDHMRRNQQPFFNRVIRHAFRESLTVPESVGMWMTGSLLPTHGQAFTCYHGAALSETRWVKVFTCTIAILCLCLQVVGFQQNGFTGFETKVALTAVPFWPNIQPDFVWPSSGVLRTAKEFESFAVRWRKLDAAHGEYRPVQR